MTKRYQLLRIAAAMVASVLLVSASSPGGARPLGSVEQDSSAPELRKVLVTDRVELHYVERGKGIPVVFVHGSLGDYSTWDAQIGPFAESYRAIAYSRRYNYPNTNQPRPNHSALVEAEDLTGFFKALDLQKVHIVGHSYGAYAALFLAVKHPELVRTLTLAEPPVVFAGQRVDEAKERLVTRARAAFAKGEPEEGVRTIVNSSRDGTYDKIPEPFRKRLLRNSKELEALVTSENMYPPVDPAAVRKLTVPTLLLSGAKSQPSQKAIDDELERLLPEKGRQRVVIPDADHSMWFQQPEACRKAVLAFLKGNGFPVP